MFDLRHIDGRVFLLDLHAGRVWYLAALKNEWVPIGGGSSPQEVEADSDPILMILEKR